MVAFVGCSDEDDFHKEKQVKQNPQCRQGWEWPSESLELECVAWIRTPGVLSQPEENPL